MDDFFNEEFADELDALADIDDVHDVPSAPKSKKLLCFNTPNQKAKKTVDELDSPIQLTPLESPNVNGFGVSGLRDKRPRDCASSDGDEDVNSLPKIAKRARKDTHESPCPNQGVVSLKSTQEESCSQFLRTINGVEDAEDLDYTDLANDFDGQVKRVLSQMPADSNCVSVTNTDGQRAYLRLLSTEDLRRESDEVKQKIKHSQLLTVPVTALRLQAEEERRNKILEDARKISDQINRLEDDITLLEECEKEGTVEKNQPSKNLWVDKYAPHRYTELLSEEALNRRLLHWLKLWDFVVFGKDLPVKKDKKKTQDVKKKWKQQETVEELDKFHRPQEKVALLCGPPGLGKTTLAHIVAQHAGYNVVEINASDDRSAEVFRNKVESATTMRAVLGPDPRPNCLIIDEIDGAPQAAINILLSLVKRTDQSTTKKKNKGGILYRPIICICNDQYVPALRQLRPLSMIFHFPPTEPTRLASRLYEIVQNERIQGEMNALLALCEKSGNDIRSCLNTLQFIKQERKEFNLRAVQTMSIGQKDSQKSLFSLWCQIFTMPRPKKNKFVNIHSLQDGHEAEKLGNNTTPAHRFQTILQAAYSTGEYEKITQGVFENYLEAKCKDPRLDAMTCASDWLCYVDRINQYTMHKQDYSLMRYTPFVFVIFHLLYASYQPPKIQFPHSQYEYITKLSKTTNLVTCLFSEMSPGVKKFIDSKAAILDMLHPMLSVMQPSLRPVNTQLYSSREKEELTNLTRIMISYNITYNQEKTLEGQYVYVLDPNIEEIVKFPGTKQHRQLTYAAKQLIAREIELEKMRRSEVKITSKNAETRPEDANAPAVPNHNRKLEPKPLVSEDKPMKNFFGNFTRTKRSTAVSTEKKTSLEEGKNEKKKDVLATDIWFHFKEGFSNAVRRNVRVHDFL